MLRQGGKTTISGETIDIFLQIVFAIAMFILTLAFSLEIFKVASPFSDWTRPWLSIGFALAAAVGMNRFFAYLLMTVYTALAVFIMLSIAFAIGLTWFRLFHTRMTRSGDRTDQR